MFITGVLAAKMNATNLGSSNTTTVTFGTLANVSYGSGYGYSTGPFGASIYRTGGSNPSPTTQTFGGQTFDHLFVGETIQYGNRAMTIEIPFESNASNHPNSNWLNGLEISDGQGNSVNIDVTSGFSRTNHSGVGNQYFKRGASYMGSSYSSNYIDTTNNDKTLTWDFV